MSQFPRERLLSGRNLSLRRVLHGLLEWLELSDRHELVELWKGRRGMYELHRG